MTNRANLRWTINEILSLQRQYELLQLPVEEIAMLHKRSVKSILYKLQSEEFIDSSEFMKMFNDLTSDDIVVPSLKYNDKKVSKKNVQKVDTDSSTNLSSRVFSLESSVNDIKNILQDMSNKMRVTEKKSVKKLQPLRKYLV